MADHARIVRAMTSVFGFVILAKLAAAAKEVVIASTYGVSEIIDAYVFGFTLYQWLPSLWIGVLGGTFIPLAARWTRENPVAWERFDRELLGYTLMAGVTGALVAVPVLSYVLKQGSFELPLSTAEVLHQASLPLSLVLLLNMPIASLSVRLMARERHANTLFEGIPALTILSVLIVIPEPGINTLVWGTVIGFALQLIALIGTLHSTDPIGRPSLLLSSPIWIYFVRGLGVILAGQFLMSLISIVDQFMAAQLDAGALSSLSYAVRLVSLVLTLVVTVISRAILPVLSMRVAAGEAEVAAQHARRWALGVLLGGGCIVSLGWFLAPWVVKLVFERGAFTSANTEVVSGLVRLGLIQLPFYASGTVLVQLLAASGRLPAIARVAAVNLAVKLVANLALVPVYGAGGLLLANAVMYAGSASAFWWLCRKRLAS